MAPDEETLEREIGHVATAEPEADKSQDPHDGEKKRKKKSDDEDIDYEVEFATPFGKLEFEFEPLGKKEKKDRERKAKAERDAAKKSREAAEKALAHSYNDSGGGGLLGKLLIVLLVLGVIAAVIGIAYWLFARPGEDDNVIPEEFADEPARARQGFVAKARGRVSDAIGAGRQASREAQREQREKFEQATGGR
jgi:hypothetical protein